MQSFENRWGYAVAVVILTFLLVGGVVRFSNRGSHNGASQKPLVSLTKSDWLLLPATERQRDIQEAFQSQCHGDNITEEAALATRLIDQAYQQGSSDTPVKQLIDYLGTSSLVCWGTIGGLK